MQLLTTCSLALEVNNIMAINFTDFSKIPVQESALKNIWEDVLTGYKIGKEPAKMEAERQAKEEEQQEAE